MNVERWNAAVLVGAGLTLGAALGVSLAWPHAHATDFFDVLHNWQPLAGSILAISAAVVTISITLRQNKVVRSVAAHKLIEEAAGHLTAELAKLNGARDALNNLNKFVREIPEFDWDISKINYWFKGIAEARHGLNEEIGRLEADEHRNPIGSPTFGTRAECLNALKAAFNVTGALVSDTGQYLNHELAWDEAARRDATAREIVGAAIHPLSTHAKAVAIIVASSRAKLRALESVIVE